jgi:TPR repeat protein
MILTRLAVLAALLAASLPAHAQTDRAGDDGVAAELRSPVKAYRDGDLAGAEAQLRHSADAGSAEGEHRLALVFAEGLAGTPRNEARAFELFQKAANAGHHRAEINLGIFYLNGLGTERDLVQARAWLEKAAANGDPYALYALGRAMEESLGPAVADPVRAADLYRRAAEKGHPLAALRYGLALMDGVGVKKDAAAAQRWLLQANQDGVPEAALALADMTVRMPALKNKAENQKLIALAVGWYQSAAEAGVASAQFKLANAYFAGAGVPRDPAQALVWYDRAARQGLPEAQNALGILLMGGVAGPRDPVEGYKWLVLAEKGGNPDSHAVREKASAQIAAADRARAEDLAARFKPVLERPMSDVPPRLMPPAAKPQ